MPRSDLFENFERMRREMDQLFGEVWGRGSQGPRRGSGFSPRVDVYYCGDPPRAIVKVDLAGIDPDAVSLEVRGRHLVVSGERPVQETEGRLYQQVEIDSGPFQRAVELGADVVEDEATARYTDGILRIELPLRQQVESVRQVRIDRPGE